MANGELRSCVGCGKETSNPKFCTQSCAAQFNNRSKPKRSPQGSCQGCGKTLPARLKRCPECKRKDDVEEERRRNGIYSVWTLDKGSVDMKLPKVSVREEKVFRALVSGLGRPLTITDTCGTLVDSLLSLTLVGAPYLQPESAARHGVLLADLKRFHVAETPYSRRPHGLVSDMPMREIGWAIREWVGSKQRAENHPLMSTFALGTAEFIRSHIIEHHGHIRSNAGGQSAEIEPLVDISHEDSRLMGFEFMDEPKFKKDMTQDQVGGLKFIARVPDGVSFKLHHSDQSLPSGACFLAYAERCHMSSGTTDYWDMSQSGSDGPEFDIDRGFTFRSGLLMRLPDDFSIAEGGKFPHEWSRNRHSLKFEVPIRWIRSVLEYDDNDHVYLNKNVPRWRP